MFVSSSIIYTANPDSLPHRAVSHQISILSSRKIYIHSPRIHNPRPIRVKHASMFERFYGLLEIRLPVADYFLPMLKPRKKCSIGQRSLAEVLVVQLELSEAQGLRRGSRLEKSGS